MLCENYGKQRGDSAAEKGGGMEKIMKRQKKWTKTWGALLGVLLATTSVPAMPAFAETTQPAATQTSDDAQKTPSTPSTAASTKPASEAFSFGAKKTDSFTKGVQQKTYPFKTEAKSAVYTLSFVNINGTQPMDIAIKDSDDASVYRLQVAPLSATDIQAATQTENAQTAPQTNPQKTTPAENEILLKKKATKQLMSLEEGKTYTIEVTYQGAFPAAPSINATPSGAAAETVTETPSVNFIFSLTRKFEEANTKKLAQNIVYSKNYSHNLETANDVDYYKIKATSHGDCYKVTMKNLKSDDYHPITLNVYDSDGAKVGTMTKYNAQSGSINVRIKPGSIYYIEVLGDNTAGKYKFSLTKLTDASSSKRYAQTVSLNRRYHFAIDAVEDVDFYKIKLNKTKNYTFYLKNVSVSGEPAWNYYLDDDLQMFVYNSSSKLIATINAGNTHENSKVVEKLKKGTYYIHIQSKLKQAGDYVFQVK